MIPDPVSTTNYRECDSAVCIANGVALPIEGEGDIFMSFQSDFGAIDIQLLDVFLFLSLVTIYCRLSSLRAVPVTHSSAMVTG